MTEFHKFRAILLCNHLALADVGLRTTIPYCNLIFLIARFWFPPPWCMWARNQDSFIFATEHTHSLSNLLGMDKPMEFQFFWGFLTCHHCCYVPFIILISKTFAMDGCSTWVWHLGYTCFSCLFFNVCLFVIFFFNHPKCILLRDVFPLPQQNSLLNSSVTWMHCLAFPGA